MCVFFLIQDNMHKHADIKLKPRFITCQENPVNVGWQPYTARAPLAGTTSLRLCLACSLMFVTCFVFLWAFEFMIHALFSISFCKFCDGTLQVLGICLTLVEHFQNVGNP